MSVTIHGRKRTGAKVLRVARPGPGDRSEKARLDAGARKNIAAARACIDGNFIRDDAPLMYSFNTGVSLFKDHRVLMAE